MTVRRLKVGVNIFFTISVLKVMNTLAISHIFTLENNFDDIASSLFNEILWDLKSLIFVQAHICDSSTINFV
jgi:hypothetical protein